MKKPLDKTSRLHSIQGSIQYTYSTLWTTFNLQILRRGEELRYPALVDVNLALVHEAQQGLHVLQGYSSEVN